MSYYEIIPKTKQLLLIKSLPFLGCESVSREGEFQVIEAVDDRFHHLIVSKYKRSVISMRVSMGKHA